MLSGQRTKGVPQPSGSNYPKNTYPSGINQNPNSNIQVNDSLSAFQDSLSKIPFKYNFFRVDEQQKVIVNNDTTLGNFFQDVDPSKRTYFNSLNKGNIGGAVWHPIFDFTVFTGFNTGYHQYDYLNHTIDSIKFYNNERPLADVFFSLILGSQQNFAVGAEYGQRYDKDAAININYKRYSHIGFYKEQAAKNTSLSLSGQWFFLNKKLSVISGYISNVNQEQNNGGIDTAYYNVQGYSFRGNVPVNLSQSVTRNDFKSFFNVSEYSLDQKGIDQSKIIAGHSISYKYGYNKFYDNDVDTKIDSLIYQNRILDSRGIRNIMNHNTLSNEFFLKNNWKIFFGKFSIIHDFHQINNSIIKSSVNDITARFKGNLKLSKSIFLNTDLKIGLGANAGSFSLKGNSQINIAKSFNIDAFAELFRSSVSYNSENLYINEDTVYQNDFTSPFGTKFIAGMKLPFINVYATAGQTLINNYIYINKKLLPVQDKDVLSITYFSLVHKLNIWKIHLESSAFIQTVNKDYISAPKQFLKSNLFLESYFFKKNLLLRAGAEIRYIPSLTVPEFEAVIGQYYIGERSYETKHQVLDLYILGQVAKKFRIFFKWDNFQDLFDPRPNYLVAFHPQNDFRIRLGVRWLLLD